MPCFLVVLALAVPRLVLLGLWFFTDWFAGLFDSLLWPIVGFVFLPTSLFWYTAVQNWFGGEWGLWSILGLILALLVDTSPAKPARR